MSNVNALKPRLVEKPWGGTFLARKYGSASEKIGEAWLLSTLTEGESELSGRPLSEALGHKLPFVIKAIDAQENLSVQVHPDDEWAKKLENSKGKTECWLILEASRGAGVYMGLKPGISAERFEKKIFEAESVKDDLEFFPVKAGDFVVVPAGTIHAIGGGVTLLEIQQASGITYRLWDWGRSGRELQIEKGLKVANFAPKFQIIRDALNSFRKGVLLSHADFVCELNQFEGTGWFVDLQSFATYQGSTAPTGPYIFVKATR